MSKRDLIPVLNGIKHIEKIKENYEIRFCREDEIEEVVEFIRKYWKEDHIFVLSRDLLDWQHHDAQNHRYSIIITKDKKNGEIGSILGAVSSSQYDPGIKYNLVWPSMWCSRNDVSIKGLGIALYYYLKETMDPETVTGIGVNPTIAGYYRSWGFEIDYMQQYYIINDEISKYQLIEVKDKKALTLSQTVPSNHRKIIPITNEYFCALKDTEFNQYSRYKSKIYYIKRYVEHPIYQYLFYVIVEENRICSVIVARECKVEGACALRIVDYAGSYASMDGTGQEWLNLLKKNNYEYVDFVCRGIMENDIKKAGFKNRKDYDVVIPNYYEPFCKQNIDLIYMYKTLRENAHKELVKGDADQDRPNVLVGNC